MPEEKLQLKGEEEQSEQKEWVEANKKESLIINIENEKLDKMGSIVDSKLTNKQPPPPEDKLENSFEREEIQVYDKVESNTVINTLNKLTDWNSEATEKVSEQQWKEKWSEIIQLPTTSNILKEIDLKKENKGRNISPNIAEISHKIK